MKIKSITLFNIGPYMNENVFDISSDDVHNIVLIGGKNGSGKTTFFNSIKTCLYGCRAWGYSSPGKEYYALVESFINFNLAYNSSAVAYIGIRLLFDDGKRNDEYVLRRSWRKAKNVEETFEVFDGNGERIDKEAEDNLTNYLLSIIPPDMFNFYFFDGESIADFFLGSGGEKNFRNAFLKLYGLDTLSLMVENFERYFRKKTAHNTSYAEYHAAKDRLSRCEEELGELRARLSDVEGEIDSLQIELQSLSSDYTVSGGIDISEWKEINATISKEEAKRDETNRWLKDAANNYIPFLILAPQMEELRKELERERNARKNNAVCGALQGHVAYNALNDYIEKNGLRDVIRPEDIVVCLCSALDAWDKQDVLLDLTDSQISRLTAQIYDKQIFDKESIAEANKSIASSIRKTKRLRDKLTSSSIEGYEEYAKKKDGLEKRIYELKIQSEKTSQEISLKEVERLELISKFNKTKDEYESALKSKSVSDLSSRAIGVYTLLEEELISRQSKILEDAFIECFSSIINKDNFVDGIVIDKSINVIPYKFIEVDASEIDAYLESDAKTGFLDMFDSKYHMEITRLRFGEKDKISLPAPITAPFSQGERQVYIMSLYLALLKTSRRDIPFFIDTPFARIDSNHRTKIVEEFFLKTSNQMFILSTDEEIVGEYKELIDGKLSNCFLLSINDYGDTSVLPSTYFEV